jgi:ATP-binding cassette subfamily B protein
MSRITEDVSKVRMYVGPAIMYAINTIALFVMVIYAMFKTNAYLSFWVLLPLPILSFSIYKISDSINKKSEAISKQLSHITSLAQEYFSGIRVLKAFVRTDYAGEVFEKASEAYKQKTISLSKTEAFFAPLMLLLIGTSTILAVFIGGNEVIRGKFTAGNIAEFVYYINMLTWPVASIGWVVSLVQRAEASQKRINEFLNQQSDIKNISNADFPTIEKIVFKDLSFTYPDTGINALKEINFEITKGQKIAIVGRTGSGKSTIAELLLRNYDPSKGNILINDSALATLNLNKLRDKIGYVPQDVFLFSETVANNISFGKENADLETIKYLLSTRISKDCQINMKH